VPALTDSPLSFAQHRLWLLDQDEHGGAYPVAGAVRLTGTLDRDALAASLSAVVVRHEVLRTVFTVVDGEPRQRVLPPRPVRLPMTDLSGISAQHAAEQAVTVARHQVERPFDLTSWPLLRAGLVRLSDTVHELVVTVHHIACDGASMVTMLDEVAAGYRHRVGATRHEPPPPVLQYADYALWQREWLTGAEHDRQLGYWRERLAGAPPASRPPTDRPPSSSPRGRSYRHVLPAALTDPLHRMAGEAGATLFMTLAAAFGALLARLSGQQDVVFGTPVSTRPDPGLIGLYVNLVALRVDLSDDPDFATLLARVRDATLAADRNRELPFEHLVEAVGRADSPLFEVLFSMRHNALPRYQLPDGDGGMLRAVPRELDVEAARFDLALTVQHDDDDNLSARWQYRREVFDGETVARFAEHFQTLLERIVAEPHRPLSTLPLLTKEQQHHQLHIWNASLSPASGSRATDLIALQAVAAPDAVALVDGDRELTYAELVAGVDALAGRLRDLGVGPEILVGLPTERRAEAVIGLLAILRAAGAYVPLEPGGATPAIVVGEQGFPVTPGAPAGPAGSPENLACVLDGGVAVTHGNLSGFLAAMDVRFGRGPQTWLATTGIGAGGALLELVWTFSAAHRVVLLDENPGEVLAAIERHGVTHLQATPELAGRLLAEDTLTVSTLDTLVLRGAAVPAALVGQLRKLTGTTVVIGYGPTEAGVYATTHQLDPHGDGVPIGRPVRGARAYILDRHLQPVPIGVTGELYLSGHGVARGYLDRPEATAPRFLPNPYGLPGSRMYRTGDLARYRADGVIEPQEETVATSEATGYKVVVNDEEQYSIWPADRDDAPGWRDAGPRGGTSDCLGWTAENWLDMRPLSLRRLMESTGEQ
jgi:non-ribosomal peptide synthetase component F